ncbi:hypothetical protein BJ742DRAFT_767200 [Cladochytrium replicatum]|nr:hypothetical protein BJ742DRAFT_767200 [Cladochytrium replicatum]
MDYACRLGFLHILLMHLESRHKLVTLTVRLIAQVAADVGVLVRDLDLNTHQMPSTKREGVDVLMFWSGRKQRGLQVKWSDRAVARASRGGHVEVSIWWKQSGAQMERRCEARCE